MTVFCYKETLPEPSEVGWASVFHRDGLSGAILAADWRNDD
jgi:hypothetical protein